MTPEIKSALLAIELHAGQTDKSGEPYYLHLVRVVAKLKTPEERTAGWLHDAVEDGLIPLNTIYAEFGEVIGDAVNALTHRKASAESYMSYVTRCCENPIAMMVKYRDLRDNMDWARLAQLPKSTRRYLDKKYVPALEYVRNAKFALTMVRDDDEQTT